MTEIPNANNLIDYSRTDKEVRTKSWAELKTLYEGEINQESLDKLASTLQLNTEQIKKIRDTLTQIIKEVKSNYLNPNQESKVKQIEMRYDELMADLRYLNTWAAEQLTNLLWLNWNEIRSKLDWKVSDERYAKEKAKSAEYYAKLWAEPQVNKVPTIVVSPRAPSSKVAQAPDNFGDWIDAIRRNIAMKKMESKNQ